MSDYRAFRLHLSWSMLQKLKYLAEINNTTISEIITKAGEWYVEKEKSRRRFQIDKP